MNILFCSVGRRAELLKNARKSMNKEGRIVATDMSNNAPGLYFADSFYIVPSIKDDHYIDAILDICREENIDVVCTLIDPEIKLLAKNKEKFDSLGVLLLVPSLETSEICFDKYKMYVYLTSNGIKTIKTYDNIEEVDTALKKGKINFPVFVKPRKGSGSVGARTVESLAELYEAYNKDKTLIVQEHMGTAIDIDADIYVDTISHKASSIFTKKKLETKIGGANKTISFKDENLTKFLIEVVNMFSFNGPIDVDVFYKDGQYYVSEINPRFGGAYLHAFGAGVDFFHMISKNAKGIENEPAFSQYEENIAMLMYDSVVIRKINSNEDN